MSDRYDFVIVGSGFGGSVSALRLSEKGCRVDEMCRGSATAVISETTSITEQAAATFTANYDTAWDFWTDEADIASTDAVITLQRADGAIVDVVVASDSPTGTAAGASEAAAEAARAAGEWTNPDGTDPGMDAYVDDVFNQHAAQDLNGTGSAASGESIQRNGDVDNNHMGDWVQAASSWGALNTGQTAF